MPLASIGNLAFYIENTKSDQEATTAAMPNTLIAAASTITSRQVP